MLLNFKVLSDLICEDNFEDIKSAPPPVHSVLPFFPKNQIEEENILLDINNIIRGSVICEE